MNKKTFRQAAVYVFYALLTTFVNWLIYSFFIWIFKQSGKTVDESEIAVANTAAWFGAVLFSFIVNKIRVFKSSSWRIKTVLFEIIAFFSTRLAVGMVEIVSVPLLVFLGIDRPLFGVEGMTSKLIVTPTVILLNYLLGKFFVFRQKTKNEKNG